MLRVQTFLKLVGAVSSSCVLRRQTRKGKSLCVHTTFLHCAPLTLRGFAVTEEIHLSQNEARRLIHLLVLGQFWFLISQLHVINTVWMSDTITVTVRNTTNRTSAITASGTRSPLTSCGFGFYTQFTGDQPFHNSSMSNSFLRTSLPPNKQVSSALTPPFFLRSHLYLRPSGPSTTVPANRCHVATLTTCHASLCTNNHCVNVDGFRRADTFAHVTAPTSIGCGDCRW